MQSATPRNVILVTFDSLAAEDMSLYGCRMPTTPEIDRLAEQAVVFENMYANTNSSHPSVFSILSGRSPCFFRGALRTALGGEEQDHLGTILCRRGYESLGVLGLKRLTFAGTVMGRFFVPVWARPRRSAPSPLRACGSPHALPFLQAWDMLSRIRRPFFLWVHSYAPHEPYAATGRFRGLFCSNPVSPVPGNRALRPNRRYEPHDQDEINRLRNRYRELIREADSEMGRFIRRVEEAGLLRDTIVVITSDHGELFDHGYQGHDGPCLYQPVIRIPLMIVHPHIPGRRMNCSAEQVDIAPTLLDMLGFPIPPAMDGVSLVPAVMHGSGVERPRFSHGLLSSGGKRDWAAAPVAVVRGCWKLIYAPSSHSLQLFNLSADPHERVNLAEEEPDQVAALLEIARTRMTPQADDRLDRKSPVPISRRRISLWCRLTWEDSER